MAFTATIQREIHVGGSRIVNGYYTNTSASTGGAILTGLGTVYSLLLQPKGSAVASSFPVVNGTMPITATDGSVTIVTTSNEVGSWIAIGV